MTKKTDGIQKTTKPPSRVQGARFDLVDLERLTTAGSRFGYGPTVSLRQFALLGLAVVEGALPRPGKKTLDFDAFTKGLLDG